MSGMSSTRVDLLTAIIATCACLKCDCGITDKYTSKFMDQLSKKWYGQNRSSRSVLHVLCMYSQHFNFKHTCCGGLKLEICMSITIYLYS